MLKRILIGVVFFAFTANAQVLRVTATVDYDHLKDNEQKDLAELASKIEMYYNNYEWVDDDYETDVNCNVKVIIETVQKKTFETIYKAQFLISSESGESFYDKNWEFPYQPSAPLDHSKTQFDPLTHFLDYYAYMVLAGELDTYGLLLGGSLYDKAMDIANLGILSQYPRGWSQRLDELQKITNVRTRPLREVKPDFFKALYDYDEGKYIESYDLAKKVLDGIKKVFNTQPNNRYLRVFFDAHYRDLANLFTGRQDELKELMDLDSRHKDTYNQYLEN